MLSKFNICFATPGIDQLRVTLGHLRQGDCKLLTLGHLKDGEGHFMVIIGHYTIGHYFSFFKQT